MEGPGGGRIRHFQGMKSPQIQATRGRRQGWGAARRNAIRNLEDYYNALPREVDDIEDLHGAQLIPTMGMTSPFGNNNSGMVVHNNRIRDVLAALGAGKDFTPGYGYNKPDEYIEDPTVQPPKMWNQQNWRQRLRAGLPMIPIERPPEATGFGGYGVGGGYMG